MLKLLLSLMLAALLPGTASAQEMGTAMIAYDEDDAPPAGHRQPGTLARSPLLERDSGKRLNEVQLGDLRQLARADDGTLLVTDYRGDRLLLLDDDLDLERRSPPAIDPMASSSTPSGAGLGHACSNRLACRPYDGAGKLQLDAETAETRADWP